MTKALAGLRRYQQAERAPAPRLMPAIAEGLGATVRDYGCGSESATAASGSAVLFVPSLINPPSILDLAEGNSLLRWLAQRGRRVLLLDWGWPGPARNGLSVTGHVERILLPLIERIGEPLHLVGYCLGGTIAAAAAQLAPVRSLVLIATPWHFSGFPERARADLARLWADSRPAVQALGVLPMEALQSAFWSLDPARTIAKFEALADMPPDRARAFVTLEDWANDGPPLAAAAARELFEDFFADDLPGSGRWRVAGETIDPARLPMPVLDIVSTGDRIVPAASALGVGERLELPQGHVGMVVGSQARQALWEPLADWLSRTAAK